MTILWCGGEDIDFLVSVPTTTNWGYYSSFARCAINVSGYIRPIVSNFSTVTSLWVSCMSRFENSGNLPLGVIKDNTDVSGIYFGKNGSYPAIYKYQSGAMSVFYTGTYTLPVITDRVWKFDFHIYNYGSNGVIDLYQDGTLILNYVGDIQVSGVAGFSSIGVANSQNDHALSEIIVSDEDTRLMRLKTHYPSATGDTSNWSGTYADIDETAISDSDLIYSGTANAEFQCNLSNLPSGNYMVKAVKVAARQNNNTGFGTQLGVKTNDTVSLAAAQQSVGAWSTKEVLYQVNPVTGQIFTMAEVDALQFAAKHVVV